jgi:hypothetical protein
MLDDSADWCGGLRVAEQRGGTARLRSLYHFSAKLAAAAHQQNSARDASK